jgi:hypothetical protein
MPVFILLKQQSNFGKHFFGQAAGSGDSFIEITVLHCDEYLVNFTHSLSTPQPPGNENHWVAAYFYSGITKTSFPSQRNTERLCSLSTGKAKYTRQS